MPRRILDELREDPQKMRRWKAIRALELSRRRAGSSWVPSDYPSLAAWYRFGIGITVAGQGVSVWADQSGNGRDLLQGTDGARPALQADRSILFNGTDEYLVATLTISQPISTYILFSAVSSTSGDVIWGFGGGANRFLAQGASAGLININFGSAVSGVTLGVGSYGVVAGVANGTSSVIQLNNGAPVTGNAGANNGGGTFIIGVNNLVSAFSNIQVKEVVIFSAAHGTEERKQVIRYLSYVGDLSNN